MNTRRRFIRTVNLLDQRREPYVETRLHHNHYRILSLFALIPEASDATQWVSANNRWSIYTRDGNCTVHLTDELLVVSGESRNRECRSTFKYSQIRPRESTSVSFYPTYQQAEIPVSLWIP